MKFNSEVTMRLAGRFSKIVARKRDGSERVLSYGFDNLILDSGLDNAAVESVLQGCAVGNGTSQPEESQSSLDSLVAFQTTTGIGDSSSIFDEENDVYGGVNTREYTFSEGDAEGNLSEIGVGWSSSALFSRELIRDENGDPTTITVLADEELVVTYQLFYLVDIDPVPWGPKEIAGETRSGFIQPGQLGGSHWSNAGVNRIQVSSSNTSFTASENEPGDPQDFLNGDNPSSRDQTSSSAGERFIEINLAWDDSRANFASGVAGFQWRFSGFVSGNFQASMDPPIMKTSDDELTMTFRVNFDRGVVPE